MGNCKKCGVSLNSFKKYVTCYKCYEELKKEALEETKTEFERQYEIEKKEENSEIFRHVCYEVWHNSFYDNLTEEQYKKRLFDEFYEIYYKKLISCKLHELETGEKKTPNEINYNLYYEE